MSVYFIQAGGSGPVKIGVAAAPLKRLRELQTAHWQVLRVIRTVDGWQRTERWFHNYWKQRRIRCEWFEFADEMLVVDAPVALSLMPAKGAVPKPAWLEKAIASKGGVRRLAVALEISPQAISQWTRISPERALDLEAVTSGAVECCDIRPDLWPPTEYRGQFSSKTLRSHLWLKHAAA